ncbi:hypothetical protein TNCV_3508211 [Trichonephila clavipes]|uniref:Uncharacterized protein n=1 Tax=Trichonephila clavipes TaxID=2585209 RepID=A0A8X6RZC6_TRICX|nr:hypothetical protein TNCV_3508211 [Trichonephila clavipes]
MKSFVCETLDSSVEDPITRISVTAGRMHGMTGIFENGNPAHMGIGSNEHADVIAKKTRDLDQPFTVTSEDANSVAKYKISIQCCIKSTTPDLINYLSDQGIGSWLALSRVRAQYH